MQRQPDKAIKFFFLSKNITLKDRKRMKFFLSSILKAEGQKLNFLNYIFCTDEYLLSINEKYLNHNYYTDIITFDLSEKRNELQAEIYISIDRVRENASKFKTSIKEELHRVMFHGILHLCGYGDKSNKQISKMREKENEYLNKYKRLCST